MSSLLCGAVLKCRRCNVELSLNVGFALVFQREQKDGRGPGQKKLRASLQVT